MEVFVCFIRVSRENEHSDYRLNILNAHLTVAAVECINLKRVSILGFALLFKNKYFAYAVFIYILYLNAEGLAYLEIAVFL